MSWLELLLINNKIFWQGIVGSNFQRSVFLSGQISALGMAAFAGKKCHLLSQCSFRENQHWLNPGGQTLLIDVPQDFALP
ncbi:MAG: hypothetical protein ACI8Q6_000925 [Granulosicoccus sp.]